MNRWRDWFDQAVRDLVHANNALSDEDYDAIARTPETTDAAKRLDKHYIPTRYPNGFDSGYPAELYTRGEAEGAIAAAEHLVEFCRGNLPE